MKNIKSIGSELADHSKTTDFSARGIIEELFPFAYVAAKRMSVRAISNWLEETHDVKISHTTIAKALKNADSHFKKIASTVFEPALILESEIPYELAPQNSMFQFLFSKESFDKVKTKTMNRKVTDSDGGFVFATFNAIEADWFSIPEEVRTKCEPFLIQKYHNMQNESQNEDINHCE